MSTPWMRFEHHTWTPDGQPMTKVTWCDGRNTYNEIVDETQARWLKRAMKCGYEKAKNDLSGWLNNPGEMK